MYEVLDIVNLLDDTLAALPSKAAVSRQTRVALIGGYTPRRCGIATFTADTHAALVARSPSLAIDIYAMATDSEALAFGPAVRQVIAQTDEQSYIDAAQAIEASGADAVWLQHEFGLFGGPAGSLVLTLVDRISAPLIITMHTVLCDPDDAQMDVMHRLIARASRIVVMSAQSAAILQSVYGADADQLVVIEHGVPDRPFGRSLHFKEKFGLTGRQVLMTFGLLSKGKGIEVVIKALTRMIADHPDLIYCIVGVTHPNLIAHEGEHYREWLINLATELGVQDHIQWVNSFVETPELLDMIEAADIYVTPYPGAGQSTSGTLSYAVALGKAVVSTPYVHARELLSDGRGILVPFDDSVAMARAIGDLLDTPSALLALQTRAYARGREMVWPAFADRCLAVIADVRAPLTKPDTPAPVGIEGLLRICDDNGVIQHSIFSVPDRVHGYCVDDNARALMLVNRLGQRAEPMRTRLATTFAAFVQSAWNPDARQFRNFMGFSRNWLEDVGSEDSCGRTIWALGATASEGQGAAIRQWAAKLFDATAPSALAFRSLRAAAFSVLGADYLLNTDPEHSIAQAIVAQGSQHLLSEYQASYRDEWHWFEPVLAYDNCRLPEALIRAGLRSDNPEMTNCGLAAMCWIHNQQVTRAGHFRPIGSNSFGALFSRPLPFDQQPVEIWAAIDGAAAAFDLTGDVAWLDHARRAYDWFGGANDRGVVVGDPISGTCHDGINPRGLNLNEGAESVLAYQLATCAIRKLMIKAG